MSTENEGAAVPPETGSRPAPPTPHPDPAVPPAPDFKPAVGAAPDAPSGPIGPPGEPAAGSRLPEPVPPAPTPPVAPPASPPAVAAEGAPVTSGTGHPLPDPAAGSGGTASWWAEGGSQAAQDGPQALHGSPGGPADPWGAVPAPPSQPPARKRSGGLVAALLAAVLVAGGIGGGIGYWAADQSDSSDSTTISALGNPKSESRTPGSVSDIAGKALPSVVTIEAQGSNGEGGTGTGFVYDTQGHILTNNHVVASAADNGKLTATFSNGKRYTAEVVGRAQGYDVAVVKLKNASGAELTPLPLGNSDKVQVGDATVAIGAPFGLSGTVTTGIVSAKNRPVASSDGGGGNASYMSALQTDASINPGNSGGPLLNGDGGVIGINSAIQSAGNGGGLGGETQQSGSIGLGFAIPINQAKHVAQQLIKTGEPVYPVIEATVNMKDTGDGATIAGNGAGGSQAVVPNGPADKAGLKAGDVIVKLNDTVIDSGPTLISEIWTHKPGDKVTITYKRDGKQSTTQVTLGQRKGDS
ncbi:trypsin-like peptidase domain-containing protein [Streptomyces milbemycinicus]|uniref:Trypsin-like peptidase domain-containing protein n=1 Tax=Streptomyces milbemycinicus TaxID=476552 RepID=A0ABW8LU35_9ACTN